MFFLKALLFAQVDPASLDLPNAAKQLFDAIVNKNWWLVAGLVVWLLVTLLRKYGANVPFLAKFLSAGWSGPFLAAVFSAAGALLTAVFAGEAITLKALFSILGAAAAAVYTQELQQKAREAAIAKIQTAEDADAFLKGK